MVNNQVENFSTLWSVGYEESKSDQNLDANFYFCVLTNKRIAEFRTYFTGTAKDEVLSKLFF